MTSREAADFITQSSAQNALRNEEAEKTILGAILFDNGAYTEASQLGLRAWHFSLDSHHRIFARMAVLADSGRPIDMMTLLNELAAHKDLEAVGDAAYVSSLVSGSLGQPSVARLVRIVLETASRRLAAKQIERAGHAVADSNVSRSALSEMMVAVGNQFQEEFVHAPEFSEDALALRFSHKYADDLRYVHGWG